MDREQAKALAKSRLGEYLSSIGVSPNEAKKNTTCPLCGSGTGANKSGAFHFYEDSKMWKCFACDACGDIFDLYARVNGLDMKLNASKVFSGVFKELNIKCDESGKKKVHTEDIHTKDTHTRATKEVSDDIKAYVRQAQAHIEEATEYLKKRGISMELAKSRGLGYDSRLRRLIIPLDNGSYQARATYECEKADRYRRPSGAPVSLFCGEVIQSNSPFYVVEGEIDALSIQMAGGNAVALSSVDNWKLIVERVEELKKGGILGAPKVIVSMDNDNVGQKASKTLVEALEGVGVDVIIQNLGGAFKDANEAIIRDPSAFSAAVVKDMDEFLSLKASHAGRMVEEYIASKSAAGYRAAFEDAVKRGREYFHSGYPRLEKALSGMKGGGLPVGLYVLGAISSLGKTTYLLQMADQAAAAGQDVIIFSLEMRKMDLAGKSISRCSFLKVVGDPAKEKSPDVLVNDAHRAGALGFFDVVDKRRAPADFGALEVLNSAKEEYFGKIGGHIFIEEGDGLGRMRVCDIERRVAQHIEITGRRPLVIVDYLQVLAPAKGHERDTDKGILDLNISLLKKIQNDFGLVLIAVSSYNRASNTTTSSMDNMNGSGMIEYSADVVISLSPKGLDEVGDGESKKDARKRFLKEFKAKAARPVILEVLKNRNGRAGAEIEYTFYAPFNYFCEKPEEGENR